jgi:APA family basic amino acid/polyamine antiporter
MSQEQNASRQKRELGFFSVVALVIGVQLGSAMFLLPSQLAPYGKWGVMSWGITGTGALALCQVFAALARYMPRVGGPHIYVRHAFGNKAAFYVGWSYWVISWLSSVPVLLLAISSLETMVGDMGTLGRLGAEAMLLVGIMVLNLRGAILSGVGEILFSILKVLPMLVIPLLTIPFWSLENLNVPAQHPPLLSLNAASLLTFWGFVGLEAGTTISDCVKNSSVVVPRALFWGTSLVIGVYILNTLAVMSVVPQSQLLNSPNAYSVLLGIMGGAHWSKMISLLTFVMCAGTLNSWILASGQVAMTASQDGIFPSFFGKKNAQQSPTTAIFLTTMLLLFCVTLLQSRTLQQQINELISLSNTLFFVIYLMVSFSLVKFIRGKKIKGSFLIYSAVGVSLLFCGWALVTTSPWVLLGAFIIPLIGWGLSCVFRWPVR